MRFSVPSSCVCRLRNEVVGLQVGIVFGDHQQSTQRLRQLALRRLVGGKRRGIAGIHVDLADLRAGFGHRGQHLLLMRGIALDRADQVGDQVGATLVLVEHFRPARLRRLVLLLDLVVPATRQQDDQQQQQDHAHGLGSRSVIATRQHCNTLIVNAASGRVNPGCHAGVRSAWPTGSGIPPAPRSPSRRRCSPWTRAARTLPGRGMHRPAR